jgi:diaminopimelate epimerase
MDSKIKKIPFKKMHGLGNDFILIDCISKKELIDIDFKKIAKGLCDRRFGIGADQLLLLYPSEVADFRMRIFNADGEEVEMCGNGIRCLAKYIWEKGLSTKSVLEIETLAGKIKPEMVAEMVKVDMGEPIFNAEKIPINLNSDIVLDYPINVVDRDFLVTVLSMGNPHAVIVLEEDINSFDIGKYGPIIERHSLFPKRTNVEFVNIKNRGEIFMRVWERGAGETFACGTGASAVAVACSLKGLTDRKVTVHLKGGDLLIEWAEDNHVYMTGPATNVFEGVYYFRELKNN